MMRSNLLSKLGQCLMFSAFLMVATLNAAPLITAEGNFKKFTETALKESNNPTSLSSNLNRTELKVLDEGINNDDNYDCSQDWYDGVADSAPGFSTGNSVANDVIVYANSSFLIEKITLEIATTNGEPTDLELKIFNDNGSGGVGTETGTLLEFDSSNMTYELTGFLYYMHPQYTVELTLPDGGLLLENDTDEDQFYWLAISAGNSTADEPLFWPSYNYPQNATSPTWQYTVSAGEWFEYLDNQGSPKESLMLVEGVCTGEPQPEPEGCEWTVQVFSNGWGDEVNWELKDEVTDEIIMAGGLYNSDFNEIRTAIAEGPVYFNISAIGNNNDNKPYYIVSNADGVLVQGQLDGGDEMTYSNLSCPDQHCIPEINCNDDGSITNVTFQEIDNTTTCSENGYGDYTDMIAEVEAGETYPISVTVGDGSMQYVSVWIDFGNDGNFDEEDYFGEIGEGAQGGSLTGEITIPESAVDGLYRMRINTYSGSVNEDPCIQDMTANGEFEDYMVQVSNPLEPEADCDQGDDSFDFYGGFSISDSDETMAADDFFVSPGNTLNVQQIEINVMSDQGIADFMEFSFYYDDGGVPESEPFMVLSDVPVTAVTIGMGNIPVYTVIAEVDLNFTEGHYWMRPKVTEGFAWWETTPVGTLGNPMATITNNTPWASHSNRVNGVFKLHCESQTPPSGECLFSMGEVEPITRITMADVDNSSSVYSTIELEDFTDIVIHAEAGQTYTFTAEGITYGDYINYFTVFIDTSELGDWSDYLTYEIGSITDSDGTDGQQAVGEIELPESLANGDYTLRVIKKYDSSPMDPCGQYSYGQAEDYTLQITVIDCHLPGNIDISDITDNSAQVVWEANGENSWEVIYGESGFDPETEGESLMVNDDPSAILTNLADNTAYDVYVRTICMDNQTSDWVGPVNFTTEPMSIDSEIFNNFTYYPNPVKEVLTLKAGNQIQTVEVYNLLGQLVMTVTPNAMETQLSTESLQSGAYLMKVNIDGATKTYRVIKR